MNASLDTCFIIHIYNAKLQNILFNRFDKILVHEFISNTELKNHASSEVLSEFDKDVANDKIQIIDNTYLNSIDMLNIFSKHVKNEKILYNPSDMGEVYAISLAKTLGCECLVTDDIKQGGPYYSLIHFEDSESIPLTFFDILLLDYIEEKINHIDFVDKYKKIIRESELNWSWKRSMGLFVRRFIRDPYSDREYEWMQKFYDDNMIVLHKIKKLKTYLEKNL